MFDSVIFDLDGTLLDTINDLADAGNHTLQHFGLTPHPVQSYKKMVGNGIPKLVQRMFKDAPPQTVNLKEAQRYFLSYYEKHMMDKTVPYPGMLKLLDSLKEQKVQLGVLSNKAHHFTCDIISHYFDGYFNHVQGLADNMPPKPDPTSLLYTAEKLGNPNTKTLYCGDSDTDMFTATAAGIKGCGVLWGFRSKEELKKAGASYLAASPDELLALISQG